ncbi:hypothetical protein DWX43_14830 [Clostridium sp. AF19-22AC]|jgi:uncharacterized protein (DUF1778 family)|uniref:hypothetical protein n=1 Tax=Clostridia TaxID=186801 RepID=UPI000E474EDF|nr:MULTISPECIES: hypothetical protein [Clostridia]RHR27106.1 hypothetical protein DWX43_14830 [Clostridium sp. AF19-22AC]
MDTKNKKNKSICIRLTDSEYNQLTLLAEQNHNTLSAYMLNQSLHPASGIYSKEFFNIIMELSQMVSSIDAAAPSSLKELTLLREEVQRLWLYLK